MELAPFVTKQITWARKHLPDTVDQKRADWWIAEIAELKRREAEAFPPAPAANEAAQHTETSAAA